jgi:hypothetical protein
MSALGQKQTFALQKADTIDTILDWLADPVRNTVVFRTLSRRTLHDLSGYQILRNDANHWVPIRIGHDRSPSDTFGLKGHII